MHVQLKDSTRKTAVEVFLSLVSVVYILFTAIWLLPDSSGKTFLLPPVQVCWPFLGLSQRWSMFAPRLRKLNQHVFATLTFDDGTSMIWETPRLDLLRLQDRYRLEKFRKWGSDYLPWDEHKELWPDLAIYVARLNYNPQNKPRMFALHTFSVEIPNVDKAWFSRDKLPEHTKYNTFFVYKYSDKDFQ